MVKEIHLDGKDRVMIVRMGRGGWRKPSLPHSSFLVVYRAIMSTHSCAWCEHRQLARHWPHLGIEMCLCSTASSSRDKPRLASTSMACAKKNQTNATQEHAPWDHSLTNNNINTQIKYRVASSFTFMSSNSQRLAAMGLHNSGSFNAGK